MVSCCPCITAHSTVFYKPAVLIAISPGPHLYLSVPSGKDDVSMTVETDSLAYCGVVYEKRPTNLTTAWVCGLARIRLVGVIVHHASNQLGFFLTSHCQLANQITAHLNPLPLEANALGDKCLLIREKRM
ncbi:hypothetical protein DPEC_G00137550 [Dallia pectoralis]|uniref:Uncharacterized protein n=1 Tax=Dallia pectoralis TaxID=75939 RepID=A0ACC2GLY8_DALPE|nr:hypothetical protein DPEC_G00137550 [Dallia pectoralis]